MAVSSALTRIMAIPTVNEWLSKVGMGATPKTPPPVDPPAPPVPADPIVSSEGVHFDRFDGFGAPYDAKHDRP